MKCFIVTLSLSLATCLATSAQIGPPGAQGELRTTLEGFYFLQSAADLDAGGDFSADRTAITGSLLYGLSSGNRLGLNLGYERAAYDFNRPTAFGPSAPWEDVSFFDLGISYHHHLDASQSLFLAPSLRFASEDGADLLDGLEWGGLFGYIKQFSPDLALGIGAGVFTGLEETNGFPFLYIYWQMAENWRLSNPFRPGPSGPAGVELVYSGVDKWEFSLGTAYRNNRFALDDNGIGPDGYAETEASLVFLRASHRFDRAQMLDLYLGTLLGGELTVEDKNGRKIESEDYDPSVVAAIAYSLRF